VSTNNHNTNIVLEEPVLEEHGPLDDILNVNGDPGPEPALPPHVATFLGEQLQAFYAQLMNEPAHERFVELLAQLDGKESGCDGE
jgi:hypothetical protein